MQVCPKCGFNGQSEETCERCGVIYARMHTVFEPRPANLAPGAKSIPPPAKPKSENGPISMVPIPMPSRAPGTPSRPNLRPVTAEEDVTEKSVPPVHPSQPVRSEVTMVPILPPPPAAKSRVPLLLGILLACLAAWGVLTLRGAGTDDAGHEEQSEKDADYYDLAVGSVVSDAQMQFRRVTDVEAARKIRDDLVSRDRRLRLELAAAPLTPEHRQALLSALDDVMQFLRAEVSKVVDSPAQAPAAVTAEAPAPPTEPQQDGETIVVARPPGATVTAAPAPAPAAPALDQSLLKHANQTLASLPH